MNTKRLRELAERVANGDGAFTWFCHDARDLARAVLAEVSEAEKAHGVLVAALPYWASNYSLAAAAKAAADELDRFYDDSAPSSGTADPLDERAREELDRISDRLGELEAHSDIARNRIAALEVGQRDLCCRLSGETAPVPAPADPLESARANVAAWPEWKRQAASQQGATLDMDGNPMPHPLDKGPDPSAPPGFEIVAEPYMYGYDDVGLPLTLILSARGRVETLFGEASLHKDEYWLAPIGRPRKKQ